MNIGKDFPKIKRGRPRMLSPEGEALFRGPMVGIGYRATRRTVQNRVYLARGLKTIWGKPLSPTAENKKRFEWLLAGRDAEHCKQTIVSQLGRVKNPDARLIFADRLCVLKLTAAMAVKLLREWEGQWQGIMAMMIVSNRKPDAKKVAHRVCEPPRKKGKA